MWLVFGLACGDVTQATDLTTDLEGGEDIGYVDVLTGDIPDSEDDEPGAGDVAPEATELEWPDGVTQLPRDGNPTMAGGLAAETWIDCTNRARVELDGLWKFAFDDLDMGVNEGWYEAQTTRSDWENITVPGTWDLAIEDGYDRQTIGWYALEFDGSELGPVTRLRFDGVFRAARVWLNGVELGYNDIPYLPFSFNVSNIIDSKGKNLLVVRVDNRLLRDTLPCDTTGNPGRHGWFPYGGITRPVTLEATGPISVSSCQIRATANGSLSADVRFERFGDVPDGVVLHASVLAPDGSIVHQWEPAELTPIYGGDLTFTARAVGHQTWSPKTPDMVYVLELKVEIPGLDYETVAYDFGFRDFSAGDGRFSLNGEDVYLHGLNRHEDHPELGPVFDEVVTGGDLTKMVEVNANFVRPGHYPNDVRTLQLMESAGLMLAEEIPVYQLDGDQQADPVLLNLAVQALKRMIIRDSNRPSIVMWSVQNEIWTFVEQSEAFVSTLADTARALDPTRPVMAAIVTIPVISFSDIDVGVRPVDVVGINEYYGWYDSTTSELSAYLDRAHEAYPDKTFFLSEYGCGARHGRRELQAMHEESINNHSYSEDFQWWFHMKHLSSAQERDWIRGVMPWVFADFRMQWNPSTGAPHPADRTNLKGIFDGNRKPKPIFELYRQAYGASDGLDLPNIPVCGNDIIDFREVCDGGERSCTELGATWASGQAVCRGDCRGWDVSACVGALEPSEYEVVKPAERDPARWAEARCNNGTPFGFRVRKSPTGTNDWVILLRGGGFCDDSAVPCFRPSDLMSSPPHDDREVIVPDDDNGGIFDIDPVVNPDFANANHVFAWYCSSDFWAGTRTDRVSVLVDPENGWYFSGRLNVLAMMEALIDGYGLGDDPDVRVLFSGTSAGGFGVMNTADIVVDQLPQMAVDGRLKLLVDAGWLAYDWDEPDMRLLLAQSSDRDVVLTVWNRFGYRNNPQCERTRFNDDDGEPGDCLFGMHAFEGLVSAPPGGLGLPVMFQQSLMDMNFIGYHNHPDDEEAAAIYGERQLAEIDAVDPGQDGSFNAWWFLGWAPYHDVSLSSSKWTMGSVGNTYRDVLGRFFRGEGGPARVIWDPR